MGDILGGPESTVTINGIDCIPLPEGAPKPRPLLHTVSQRGNVEIQGPSPKKTVIKADFPVQKFLGEGLKNQKQVDYAFVIGAGKEQRKFQVHKSVLEVRSPVFCAEVGDNDEECFLILPDLDPSAFGRFLVYVYTDKLPANLSADDLLNLLDVAVKFNPPRLVDKCAELLRSSMDVNNVCQIYQKASLFGLNDLEQFALPYIMQNVGDVLGSYGFLGLTLTNLAKLLKSGFLRCSQLDIFNAVIRWGSSKIASQNTELEAGGNQLQEVIKDLIPLIQFSLMTSKELESVLPVRVLSLEEIQILRLAENRYPDICPAVVAAGDYSMETEDREETFEVEDPTGNLHESQDEFQDSYIQNDETMTESLDISVATASSSRSDNYIVISDSDEREGDNGVPSPKIISFWSVGQVRESRPPNLRQRKRSINYNVDQHDLTPPLSDASVDTSTIYTNMRMVPKPKRRKRGSGNDSSYSDTEYSLITNARPIPQPTSSAFVREGIEIDYWERYIRKMPQNVRRVTLKDCSVINRYPKAEMPMMKDLFLDLKVDVDDHDEKFEFHRFLRLFDLKQYIFFQHTDNWRFHELWRMKVNKTPITITVIVNGVTLFKMNRAKKELTINLNKTDATDIMYGLVKMNKNELEKLYLANTDLPPFGFPRNGLREIVLHHVIDYFKSELDWLLQKCPNLERFSCWIVRQKWDNTTGVRENVSLDLVKDLISQEKLQYLALSRTNILYDPKDTEQAKKVGLTELYTDYCHWSQMIYEHFHLLFPNLKKVFFRRCDVVVQDVVEKKIQKLSSAVTIRLMTNILKIGTIEWIRVWGMDWKERHEEVPILSPSPPKQPKKASSSSRNTRKSGSVISFVMRKDPKDRETLPLSSNSGPDPNPQRHVEDEEVAELKMFLGAAGLEGEVDNFLLEKDLTTNEWRGTVYDESESKDLDNGSWQKMDQLEYEYFLLNNFYKDCPTYQNAFDPQE